MNNIVDIIAKGTKRFLKRIAVIDGCDKISYAELLETVEIAGAELKDYGIVKHQRVALLCEDGIDYIVASLAVLKLYAVIVPVPLGSSLDEIESLLDNIKVNFIIFERNSYAKKEAIPVFKKGAFKKELFIYCCNSKKSLPEDFFKLNPAFIRFTSGTTGENKGVVLSHQAIIARTEAANRGLKVTSKDRIIWVLSMSFHFVVTILLFLRRGATIIISSRQFPYELLDNLKKYQFTLIYASPLHYHMLASLSIPRESLSHVRLAISTAVKLAPDIADKFFRKFGFELAEAYGIIELGLPFINTSGSKLRRGSVGKVLAGYKIKIEDPDTSGIGVIYIKGKGTFNAYFSPWRNSKDILVNGWFNTGDLGKLDKDGFLFIVGREKNMINFSGMKIFPFEVESIINCYPCVKESLVYGVNHIQYGQLPSAKIVLKETKKGSFDLEKLRKFCYEHLASYKVPKEFYFVKELSKTRSGKVKVTLA